MYLIQSDFKKQIQSDNLSQITGGDSSVLNAAMLTAQEEVSSYLVQKYDTSQEFRDLNDWDITQTYKPADRFYIDAQPYLQQTYNHNDLTLQNGSVYINNTPITTPEPFSASKWTLLGLQYQKFYGAYPANTKPFQYGTSRYSEGSKVYYNGFLYTALKASGETTYDAIIQGDYIPVVLYANYFPDDPQCGAQYWGSKTSYSLAPGTLPTNATFYTSGDNRSQQLLTYMIDIALYHIHSRIAPRNIPDLRVKRYDDALSWLKKAAKGDITPNLPVIQSANPLPPGARIRYGSHPKQRNNY